MMGKSKCQKEEKVLPCEIRHMLPSCILANCPNRCGTEICLSLTKSSKKKEGSHVLSSVLDAWRIHPVQGSSRQKT